MHELNTGMDALAGQRRSAEASELAAAPYRTVGPDASRPATAGYGEPLGERSGARQAHGAAGQLRRAARALMAKDPFTARAIDRVAKRVERLVAALETEDGHGWRRRLAGAGRQLSALLRVGAISLGAFRRRVLSRPGAAAARTSSPPPAPFETDQSRMPRHDRPSGYFSARREGAMTNTTRTVMRPRQ